MVWKLQSRGTHAHRGGNGRPWIPVAVQNQIIELFDNNPSISIPVVAAQTGVSWMTVWNYLRKELKRYPYKLQMSPALSYKSKLRRLEFAQHCRKELRNGTRYLKRIIFSDECLFAVSGRVNKQNCLVWGADHPTEVHEVRWHSPKVMAWCDVSNHEIIGPYFLKSKV